MMKDTDDPNRQPEPTPIDLDALALREKLEHRERELAKLTLEVQLRLNLVTHTEILGLMAHDLGHRAIAIVDAVEELGRFGSKVIREEAHRRDFMFRTERAVAACQEMESSLVRMKKLSFPEEKNSDERFSVAEALEDVLQTVAPALSQNNIAYAVDVPASVVLYGDRMIFQQIVLTLVINSIEAQKQGRRMRRNTIRIYVDSRAAGETQALHILYRDDGPGIDRTLFPNPQDIFELGATSKPKGTGTGLTICRSLLARRFGGSMTLEVTSPPIFKLVLPLRNAEESP